MFHCRLNLVASRGFIVAIWLALLAGCNVPTPPPLASVAAPTQITALAGDATVVVAWTASAGATGYYVKRSFNPGGPYGRIATTTATTYTDTPVTNGTRYYYVVSALNAEGEGPESAQADATPQATTVIPAVPTNVVGTGGNAQVTLTWTGSAGATEYRVKRASVSGGPYTQIATSILTSYVDTALVNGTTYYYVITASNSVGESAASAQASAIPSLPPPSVFGTWTNVTPSGIDLTSTLCSNFGAKTVQVDPAHPSDLYTAFDCQGIWKSTDYGVTWTGPINTGTNGALVSECSGGISIPPSSTAPVPTLYQACIRGNAEGFWRSTDGGVNWTKHVVLSVLLRQDYFQPVVDPYDANHLLMAAHEFDSLVESIDGGLTWTSVPLNLGMLQLTLNSSVFFVNTGNAQTTRGTWLWMGQTGSGTIGTWRTGNSGTTWTQVNKSEGTTQIYQPDSNGIVYMAGIAPNLPGTPPTGVLRSGDYGQTWIHVGSITNAVVAFGTPKNVYSMYGFPVGPGGSAGPNFQVATQPGTGTWVSPSTPPGLMQGPAQVAVTNNGTQNIFVGAMYNNGIWRYVEP